MNINDIIIEHEGLIYKIINKYRYFFEIEDLYQVAVIGLIKAYKNYRLELSTKFISYAYPYILGEVIKYIHEYRPIKTNKSMVTLYAKILQTKDILSQRLMRIPTTYEISIFLEIDEDIINNILQANEKVESLDRIISEDGKNLELYDKFGYLDASIENYPLQSELEKLPKEERDIIISRYYNDMSQQETGQNLGMYQVEVSRKEKQILKKLRNNIAA